MLIKTLEVMPGLCVTVKTATGRSYFDTEHLFLKYNIWGQSERDKQHLVAFIQAVVQSSVKGNIGFEWPTAASSLEELEAAREWFFDLPKQPFIDWLNAITEVDTPPVDPDLLPENLLSDEKKETSES